MRIDAITQDNLKAFARGEMTWAQVEGITAQEAREIAQVGCDLSAAGRLDEARVIFEGLVEINPLDAAARAALGTVYQRMSLIKEALETYGDALKVDPKNVVALGNRGELRLRANDPNGLHDLADAVKADPRGETEAGKRARALAEAITAAAATAGKQ